MNKRANVYTNKCKCKYKYKYNYKDIKEQLRLHKNNKYKYAK